jgi:hypothetical protein
MKVQITLAHIGGFTVSDDFSSTGAGMMNVATDMSFKNVSSRPSTCIRVWMLVWMCLHCAGVDGVVQVSDGVEKKVVGQSNTSKLPIKLVMDTSTPF